MNVTSGSAQLLWLLRGSGSATVEELVEAIGEDQMSVSVVQRALFDGTSLFEHDGASPPRWSVLTGADFPLTRVVPELALRPWQEDALQEWLAAGKHAVVEAVTGTGKTAVGIAAIADAVRRGLKVVVLVPSISLMDQWARSLKKYLPRVRVGRQGDGSADSLGTHNVLLSMVQSASRKAPFDGESGCLLVADEVHRYGASSFARTLSIGFTERLGLTATYERADDSVDTVLRPFFGTTIDGCSYRRGYDEGILAPIRLMTVGVAFTVAEQLAYNEADEHAKHSRSQLIAHFGVPQTPFGTFMSEVVSLSKDETKGAGCWAARRYLKAFAARRAVLANSDAKMKLLARLAPALRGPARSIVFSETIDAADASAEQLASSGVPVASMTSGATPREREALLEEFRRGKLSVLATAKLLDEGIDIPEAEVGIILAASKTRRQMIQRMGRIIRPKVSGRHATFVIVYVAGTSEDPASGAHETFLEQITDIAVEVKRAAAGEAVEILSDWLAVEQSDQPGELEPELKGFSFVESAPDGTEMDQPEDWTVDAILNIVDEFEGLATWSELVELLPDPEIKETLLVGNVGTNINWMPMGSELVCYGGRLPAQKSERIHALTLLARVHERNEGITPTLHSLRAELGSSLVEVSDVRLWELWSALSGGSGVESPVSAVASKSAVQGPLFTTPPAVPTAIPVEQASDVEIAHQQFVMAVERGGATAHRVQGTRRTAFVIRHPDGRRHVALIRVRTSGDWQGQKSDEDRRLDDTHADVWVFIDCSVTPTAFYILPAQEVADGVRREVDDWVAKDPSRTRLGHYAFRLANIKHGLDRWDLLGIGNVRSPSRPGNVVTPVPAAPDGSAVAPIAATKTPKTDRVATPPRTRPVAAPRTRPVTASKSAKAVGAKPPQGLPPMSGVGHVRVRLDCFGERVTGIYDPKTGQIQITRAMKYPKLVNRRYATVHYAEVGVKTFIGGGKLAASNMAVWTYDDGSGRTIS
ncbi:DEAD/DEAH box helicase [Rhodococcoides fascians]|uniref:DEAD/DEAH box helicase n=1 Tax=Rhodococcoides fascians TaxID=1828 RepID=UPI0006920D3D|nr:DEAD/DEAH box helicase [Rhodococcus fascians]